MADGKGLLDLGREGVSGQEGILCPRPSPKPRRPTACGLKGESAEWGTHSEPGARVGQPKSRPVTACRRGGGVGDRGAWGTGVMGDRGRG